jgi:transmembrane sensor
VERGKVEVEWAESITRLSAGESRWFPGEGEQNAEEPAVAAPAEEPALPAQAQSAPVPSRSALRERFVEHALRGEYAAAYAIMSESPSAVGNSAEDLLLAADSARLSNHPEQAVVYLRRLTREHAKDSRAPLAAFTLGRVLMSQLGRPGEAEGAFALVRKLSPGGALAEDALARQAEALWRAGSRERARSLALEYRSRHPNGKHLSSLQKLGALD